MLSRRASAWSPALETSIPLVWPVACSGSRQRRRESPRRLPSHKVESFGRCELRAFNSELLDDDDDFAKVAQRDEWDYHVDSIVGFRPEGPRRLPSGSLRRKDAYQFLVKYKFLPISDEPGNENPSWQPFANLKATEALFLFCRQPEISRQLGADFCPNVPGTE